MAISSSLGQTSTLVAQASHPELISRKSYNTDLGPQFEHFVSRGGRVVAVDLRGHGQRDTPHQRYTHAALRR